MSSLAFYKVLEKFMLRFKNRVQFPYTYTLSKHVQEIRLLDLSRKQKLSLQASSLFLLLLRLPLLGLQAEEDWQTTENWANLDYPATILSLGLFHDNPLCNFIPSRGSSCNFKCAGSLGSQDQEWVAISYCSLFHISQFFNSYACIQTRFIRLAWIVP